jgi:hypothetical protein
MSQLGDAPRGVLVRPTRGAWLLFVIPAGTSSAPLINTSAAYK